MNRRNFLQGCLASATAPYVITTAGLLMPVKTLALPKLSIRWIPVDRALASWEVGWDFVYNKVPNELRFNDARRAYLMEMPLERFVDTPLKRKVGQD